MSRDTALVTVEWLAERLGDPDLVLLEVDERPDLYRRGHIDGAHCVDWHGDLLDPVTRDIPSPAAMQGLWRRLGITERSTVVFYGDQSNWYACFGYWLFTLYGRSNLRLLDGGRQAWLAADLPLGTAPPRQCAMQRAPKAALVTTQRAYWFDVARGLKNGTQVLDVRTEPEYRGDLMTEPGYPNEAAQRAGHIPGAISFAWDLAVGPRGTIVPDADLRSRLAERGVRLDGPTITYCRIGERSAHTWFVLRELLGLQDVRNYDGSWTEWGSMIGMPVALGAEAGALSDFAPVRLPLE